jgi:hypothetical protein
MPTLLLPNGQPIGSAVQREQRKWVSEIVVARAVAGFKERYARLPDVLLEVALRTSVLHVTQH